MPEPLLRIDNLTKRFGSLAASDGLSLDVVAGEVHAVIGPNGAGKTTLISQLFGELTPDAGAIFSQAGTSARLRLRNVFTPVWRVRFRSPNFCRSIRRSTMWRSPCRPAWVTAFIFGRMHAASPRSATRPCTRFRGSGSAPAPASWSSEMSHGEQKQLELAIALATRPQLLLLDEPMAGLGATECASTVALLRSLKGAITILLVEHDMDAVFALADRISVLANGRRVATGTAE